MARIILDSNVIIYISQKKLELKDLPVEYDEILISSVSCMEVLGFNFPEEETEKALIEFIDSFIVVDTNFEIRKRVIEYRKKKKIKLPDAIILASAAIMKADLFTYNVDDFKNIDEQVKLFNLPIVL
jgi:predicted nucleic acid-binding protein